MVSCDVGQGVVNIVLQLNPDLTAQTNHSALLSFVIESGDYLDSFSIRISPGLLCNSYWLAGYVELIKFNSLPLAKRIFTLASSIVLVLLDFTSISISRTIASQCVSLEKGMQSAMVAELVISTQGFIHFR